MGSTTLKLLKRGAGDEREASDLVPRDFPLEIGKTVGTRLKKPKWGMMGTCACRARAGRDGNWRRSWSGAFSPFPNTPFAPTFDN